MSTDDQHVNQPHEPGDLYDCHACRARCHCAPGAAECVFDHGDEGPCCIGFVTSGGDDRCHVPGCPDERPAR